MELKLGNVPALFDFECSATGGEPLPCRLRVFLEARFEHPLPRVRIHADGEAAACARKLQARAFAIGQHLFFGEGEFHPENQNGLWLLAHELAHVVQQEEAPPSEFIEVGGANSWEERECDRAADAVVFGLPMPRLSRLVTGQAVLRRKSNLCPGFPAYQVISAGAREIYGPANEAIEGNYLATHPASTNSILFGSQFISGRDIRVPQGAPNKRFANHLLENLRGISQQLRPDIIDFDRRVFYEIKTEQYAEAHRNEVSYQLRHYYDLTELIRREYGSDAEPPWDQEQASWKPLPILFMPGSKGKQFVCTAATDYQVWPSGLVLYDVRQKTDDEEERAVKSISLTDYDRDFAGIMPGQRKFKQTIAQFNPYLPEFVIIAPQGMYQAWKDEIADARFRRMYEVKVPPFLNPKTTIGAFHRIGWTMVGLTAAAYAALYMGVILLDPAVFEVEAVAVGGAGAGGGAEVVSLAAYRAMLASSAAQQAAKAAGVLIVVGLVGNANASQATIRDVTAVRVVPVEKFKPYRGQQAFSSSDDVPGEFLHTQETIQGQFKSGTTVLYDWEPYVIIARVSVTY